MTSTYINFYVFLNIFIITSFFGSQDVNSVKCYRWSNSKNCLVIVDCLKLSLESRFYSYSLECRFSEKVSFEIFLNLNKNIYEKKKNLTENIDVLNCLKVLILKLGICCIGFHSLVCVNGNVFFLCNFSG